MALTVCEKQALQVRLYRDEASTLIYPAGEYTTQELCISAAKECDPMVRPREAKPKKEPKYLRNSLDQATCIAI